MTTVTVEYDCFNACRYDIPTALKDSQSALSNAALIDTLTAMADAQHDRECPTSQQTSKPNN
ncbi:hypothetical protein QQG74_09090 [Micromonospora sp. FIMYZ51]|uniref:hypothetical protein n=1 Tax=Micromonospora sp. FIMYZ51 TaxID=3051832 RepID=UPI00311EF26B